MAKLDIRPFSDAHLDDAAALLAERHARHLEAEPLLKSDADFRAEIEALRSSDGATGMVALRGSALIGYLLGVRKDDAIWGPNVWVEPAGHAVKEPEVVRDLYGVAAAEWIAEGRNRHYAVVPATDAALVDAWFRLSFGAMHAGGIQETPSATPPSPESVDVRKAGAADVDAVVELENVLLNHQRLAPVFSGLAPWSDQETRDDFLGEVDDPELGLFIAELEGRPVGLLGMVPAEKSSMHSGLARPDRSALLAFAATLPDAQGSGAGLAMTNAGLDWAREHGYPVVLTDWRETNLLSSRFWPARGFRRTFLRLYRSIP